MSEYQFGGFFGALGEAISTDYPDFAGASSLGWDGRQVARETMATSYAVAAVSEAIAASDDEWQLADLASIGVKLPSPLPNLVSGGGRVSAGNGIDWKEVFPSQKARALVRAVAALERGDNLERVDSLLWLPVEDNDPRTAFRVAVAVSDKLKRLGIDVPPASIAPRVFTDGDPVCDPSWGLPVLEKKRIDVFSRSFKGSGEFFLRFSGEEGRRSRRLLNLPWGSAPALYDVSYTTPYREVLSSRLTKWGSVQRTLDDELGFESFPVRYTLGSHPGRVCHVKTRDKHVSVSSPVSVETHLLSKLSAFPFRRLFLSHPDQVWYETKEPPSLYVQNALRGGGFL